MKSEKTRSDSSISVGKWAASLLAHLLLLAVCALVSGSLHHPATKALAIAGPHTAPALTTPELTPTETREPEATKESALPEFVEPPIPVVENQSAKEINAMLLKAEAEARLQREAWLDSHPPTSPSRRLNPPRADASPRLRPIALAPPSKREAAPPVPATNPQPKAAAKPPTLVQAGLAATPDFPRSLLRRFRGMVEWKLEISALGDVINASKLKGTGDEHLDSLVAATLSATRFTPATSEGRPVASILVLEIEVR